MTVTLVLGGARSGKSRHAESLAHGRRVYVATAQAIDDEMSDRITKHRAQRGDEWETIEAPLDLASTLMSLKPGAGTVLVDCITVWLGNLMHLGRDIPAEVQVLCAALKSVSFDVIIVSNEVGLSIVPENPMARRFRDEQGLANQRLAAVADQVIFMAAGLPLRLK
jgi:adenosylcobinamide kinase/adenosylcobinamide-phosphate guanylyltransferase